MGGSQALPSARRWLRTAWRWCRSLWDPMRLDLRSPGGWRRNRRVLTAFAVMTAGLAVTLIPEHLDTRALGTVNGAGNSGSVPTLCFLAGDLCLAVGVQAAARAARGRQLERLTVAVLGAVSAALAGPCARLVLEIVLLHRLYRPSLFLASPARAAAIGWGILLAVTVTAGFAAPAVVAVANLVPRWAADVVKPVRWLAGRRGWLLAPFAALAATVIITQWVLPGALAAAMGYSYPTISGVQVTVSLRALGPEAWSSLQILAALPLVVGMWEGVEAARSCHRLVRRPDGTPTKLLVRARRLDHWYPATAFVLAAAALAAAEHAAIAMLAGAALLLVVVLSTRGRLGPLARLTGGFERRATRWQLPEEWRELGPVSLVLAVLVFPVAGIFGRDIYLGAEAAAKFPFDARGFYFYWRSYGIVRIPVVTAGGIYGHVEDRLWQASLVLAGIIIVGIVINGPGRRDMRGPWKAVWLLLRVAVFALALAPVAQLADHSYAMFLLTACAIITVAVVLRGPLQPAAVWSTVLAGGVLSLWSLTLWHTTWIPAAAVAAFTIAQRFAFNAGPLNTPDQYRENRIAYFQALALLSAGMLALGHGATPGYFDTDAISTVTDRISLSAVAAIWLVLLTTQQARAVPIPHATPAVASTGPVAPGPTTPGDGASEAADRSHLPAAPRQQEMQ